MSYRKQEQLAYFDVVRRLIDDSQLTGGVYQATIPYKKCQVAFQK